jgi:hypothetical protein
LIDNLQMGIFRNQALPSSKQSLLMFTFACFFVILSSCSTTDGRAPLTAAEDQFFDRIDPNAFAVTKISEETIEVKNTTYPAIGYWRYLGAARFLQVIEAVKPYVQKMNMVYDAPANRYCASNQF